MKTREKSIVVLLAAGLFVACATTAPSNRRVAASLTAIASDLAAKGQWDAAGDILRNVRELEPGDAALMARVDAIEARRRSRGSGRAAELPYRFSLDGFEVDVSSAEITTSVSAFGRGADDPLDADERWLSASLTVLETQGRERVFPWITMLRLRTALGHIVSAPHAIRSRSTATGADLGRFNPNEREDIRMFFRVKRGDFPVHLVCADGAEIPLGE